MSFLAEFIIDNSVSKVINCHYGMTQTIMTNGRASQKPVGGGIIELELESTSSTEFFDWMACPDKRKSGSITFYRRDAMSRLKRLDFTDALCVSFCEDFRSEGSQPMVIKMKLSAREMSLEDISVVNDWNAEA